MVSNGIIVETGAIYSSYYNWHIVENERLCGLFGIVHSLGYARLNATSAHFILEEEFEDTKGVIRIRNSKKDRQHSVQNKTDTETNKDLQNIRHKSKIE